MHEYTAHGDINIEQALSMHKHLYITISLIHGSIPLITSIHHHIINSWFYTTICLTDAYTACNIIIPNHTACYTPVTVIAEYCFLARIMHI